MNEISSTAAPAIRDHFEMQAKACDGLGSPFTARLCRTLAGLLDESTRTGRRVLEWPGNPRDDALALRLCGGLHALVLLGSDRQLAAIYPPQQVDDQTMRLVLTEAIARNDQALFAALDNAPQTNEIARSGMLLPGFLAIARETGLPFALHEIGSSAALNLQFDRFFYRYGEAEWGDVASPVRLAPVLRGKLPPLDGELGVLSRHGCDVAPVDIGKAADRLRLRSYIWADQAQRLERLDAAIGLASSTAFTLEKADAADFVRAKLATRQPGSVFVLFHSIMWQYMPQSTRDSIAGALEEAGKEASGDAPIAWLRMEPLSTSDPFATLSLTLWPGGETRHLAKCDYHGRWIEWL
ncbi:hypothetical protein M2281_001997 [Mesorhizobium soli]|uniref:DUF2332 domain-containing protein n=1 Tax=Pseudaminobacter soli (ex Li et al. 2025) TaxID=1295366 RepID=UPI002474BA6F|nr:DUF2332 family protein [Mesorhizobium soli]MDH6231425.1 hypothetical protein [Mesorhizobium soli]